MRPPRRLAVALAAAVLLVVPGLGADDAQARTRCEPGTPAEKGEAAASMLRYPWRDLGYTVEYRSGHPKYLGATYEHERRIEIYVGRCQTVASVAHVLGHEVGHAVDFAYNDGRRRLDWQAVRGFQAEWFACEYCPDYAYGSGDFAEVFSYLKASPTGFRSKLAGPPSPEQAAALERFFHAEPPPPPPTPPGLLEILSRVLPSLAPLL